MSAPVLVGCAHGTRDPAGRRAMARLRLDVAARRPDLTVLAANVDVQKPQLAAVVAREVTRGRPVVIVPLLLSSGYHRAVDVARAVEHGRALGGQVRATPALGPDALLVDVLVDRLDACGTPDGEPVVLAAAGSSDPRARVDVEAVAAALAQRRDAPVSVGFLSAQGPGVAEALTAAGPGPVTVATYLLAPGYFADRLNGLAVEHGAAHLTEALAPHPLLAELVLRRFEHHLQQDHVGPAPVGGGGRATDRSRLIDLDRTDGTGAG